MTNSSYLTKPASIIPGLNLPLEPYSWASIFKANSPGLGQSTAIYKSLFKASIYSNSSHLTVILLPKGPVSLKSYLSKLNGFVLALI